MSENTSEKHAVDEIIAEEENKIDYSRSTPSKLCPNCGTDIDTEVIPLEFELVECTDYCRHCGWESDPYYV